MRKELNESCNGRATGGAEHIHSSPMSSDASLTRTIALIGSQRHQMYDTPILSCEHWDEKLQATNFVRRRTLLEATFWL